MKIALLSCTTWAGIIERAGFRQIHTDTKHTNRRAGVDGRNGGLDAVRLPRFSDDLGLLQRPRSV